MVVEDRVKDKARELGWTPEQTLRAFLRKDIAIAGIPPAVAAILQRDNNQDRTLRQSETDQGM